MQQRGHGILREAITPPGALWARVVGGNLLNGCQQIAYLADPIDVPALYDPAVDTASVDGIGFIDLIHEDGEEEPALLRHNAIAYGDALPLGRTLLVIGPFTATVDSGADAGQPYVYYKILRG